MNSIDHAYVLVRSSTLEACVQDHLLQWLECAPHLHVSTHTLASMLAEYEEDPEYWGDRGWTQLMYYVEEEL